MKKKKKENKLLHLIVASLIIFALIHLFLWGEYFYRAFIYPIYNNAAEKEASIMIPFAKEHKWEKLSENSWIVGFGPRTGYNVIYQSDGSLEEVVQQVKKYLEEDGYTMFPERLTCDAPDCEWPDGKKQNNGYAYWLLEGGGTYIVISDKNYFNRHTWRTEDISSGKIVINMTFKSQ